tara:strand:+ start:884 stop:1123 length:240 start_codon:yes stop_codon:yes gene_type:complete
MSIDSQEELSSVMETLKIRKKDLARELVSKLSIGDIVLIDNRGRVERGTIQKVNRTRAVVDIEEKGYYDVPFTMIRKEQ